MDSQTLSLSYSPRRFLPAVRVEVKVESLNEESLILSYNGKAAMNMLIRGFIVYMNERIDKDIIRINLDKKLIQVRLRSIRGLEKTFEYLTPSTIFFDEEKVHVSFLMM
ncbi:MAG: hypothetical protein LUH22_18740 [Bacteroides sp.]|nr:hypothetical protein [Bacteroides sp.]